MTVGLFASVSLSAVQVHCAGNRRRCDGRSATVHAAALHDDRRLLCRPRARAVHGWRRALGKIPAPMTYAAAQPDAHPPHAACAAFSAQSAPGQSAPLRRQTGGSSRVRSSSKIKGSARDRLPRLVCTGGRTARGQCPVVLSWLASARADKTLCVPSTMHYAPALWSQRNGHT